jgi:Na+/H+ antiporter NhaA
MSQSDRIPLYIGPLSIGHWINDGLMAVFFLLVGLEIKREALDGQLSTWSRRALPGIAAAGGMAVPALIYLAFNPGPTAHGWAIPAATGIAFALGAISLLGKRVPASLRVFLTALAIVDDLGAVIIIAFFYTAGLSLPDLAGAAAMVAVLIGMNRLGVRRLTPYLLLGLVLWVLVLRSGVHATLAGVILVFTIPLHATPARPDAAHIRLGLADMPAYAGRLQMAGTALLCGIGFTMSLFITLLAFPGEPLLQAEAKIGILGGSLLAGLLGYALLRMAPQDWPGRHPGRPKEPRNGPVARVGVSGAQGTS